MRAKEETQERPATAGIPVAVSAWLVPGGGPLTVGRTRRALTFFLVVTGMFALGLYLRGELFPLDTSEPLTFLAGLAEIGVGLPFFAAKLLSRGSGEVPAQPLPHPGDLRAPGVDGVRSLDAARPEGAAPVRDTGLRVFSWIRLPDWVADVSFSLLMARLRPSGFGAARRSSAGGGRILPGWGAGGFPP